jgi:hypothetical protein
MADRPSPCLRSRTHAGERQDTHAHTRSITTYLGNRDGPEVPLKKEYLTIIFQSTVYDSSVRGVRLELHRSQT